MGLGEVENVLVEWVEEQAGGNFDEV